MEADPVGVQLGVRLTRSAPLTMETLLPIKGCLACEHVINGPRQLVGHDGEGFALAMLLLQTSQVFLACGMIAQDQHRRLGNSPFEVGITELLARGASAFASGFLGTLHQATIRDKILHAWEAIHVMDFLEQHAAAALADTRHRLPQIQGLGVMVFGGLEDGQALGRQAIGRSK
jgi:hypothetical protein